jgi:hypothetical protein
MDVSYQRSVCGLCISSLQDTVECQRPPTAWLKNIHLEEHEGHEEYILKVCFSLRVLRGEYIQVA